MKLRAPVPIYPLVEASDLVAATRAANIPCEIEPSTAADVANILGEHMQAIVSWLGAVKTAEIKSIANTLAVMARDCQGVILPIAGSLAEPDSLETSLATLTQRVADTDDPVVIALRGGAQAAGQAAGQEDSGASLLAEALLSLSQLSGWASGAAEQIRIGAATAQKVNQQNKYGRTLQVEFGHAAIAAYEHITGRPAKRSRTTSGNNPNRPSGPLTRFLRQLFAQVRERCATIPHLAVHLDRPELNPSPETLHSWIQSYKAAARDPLNSA